MFSKKKVDLKFFVSERFFFSRSWLKSQEIRCQGRRTPPVKKMEEYFFWKFLISVISSSSFINKTITTKRSQRQSSLDQFSIDISSSEAASTSDLFSTLTLVANSTRASYARLDNLGSYSRNFIFFLTYKCAPNKLACVFPASCYELPKLIGTIRRLQRKQSVVNTVPDA